jgi:pimeloyl-ACP methyl ester carboxylesterase
MLEGSRRQTVLAIMLAAGLGFAAGFLLRGHGLPLDVLARLAGSDSTAQLWSEAFSEVEIDGSRGSRQRAWFVAAKGAVARPLLVSLHTWSGDYMQPDPLAGLAVREGWNYIHPDFGGRNDHPDACLSDKALADIDAAIDFAMRNGHVDLERVFVVGMSGGGYAALGLYLRTRHRIHTFLSWVPISDLAAWYHQSRAKGLQYARDIANCIGTGGVFNTEAAMARSPLYWNIGESPAARLEIYAGINDGHEGSVPISHSIQFFNRMAGELGFLEQIISQETSVGLLTRSLNAQTGSGDTIDGRSVVFSREAGQVSITIFDGGHEILPNHVITRVRQFAAVDRASPDP